MILPYRFVSVDADFSSTRQGTIVFSRTDVYAANSSFQVSRNTPTN
tara:strand:- start:373 stop:510 length:138 start_codon:yes stop_codon:yes gene_type:complete